LSSKRIIKRGWYGRMPKSYFCENRPLKAFVREREVFRIEALKTGNSFDRKRDLLANSFF